MENFLREIALRERVPWNPQHIQKTKLGYLRYHQEEPIGLEDLRETIINFSDKIEVYARSHNTNYQLKVTIKYIGESGYIFRTLRRKDFRSNFTANNWLNSFDVSMISGNCSGEVIYGAEELYMTIIQIPLRGDHVKVKHTVNFGSIKNDCQMYVATFIKYHEKVHPDCKANNLSACVKALFNKHPVSMKKMLQEVEPTAYLCNNMINKWNFEEGTKLCIPESRNKYHLVFQDDHVDLVGNTKCFFKTYVYNNVTSHNHVRYCAHCQTTVILTKRNKYCDACEEKINFEADLTLVNRGERWQRKTNVYKTEYILVHDFESYTTNRGEIVPFMWSWLLIDVQNKKILKSKTHIKPNEIFYEDSNWIRDAVDEMLKAVKEVSLNYFPYVDKETVPEDRPSVCSFCKEDKPLVVHHDHRTGNFIAYVCYSCNSFCQVPAYINAYSWNGTRFDTVILSQHLLQYAVDYDVSDSMFSDGSNKFRIFSVKSPFYKRGIKFVDAMELFAPSPLKDQKYPVTFFPCEEKDFWKKHCEMWMKEYKSFNRFTEDDLNLISEYCTNDCYILANVLLNHYDICSKSVNIDPFGCISAPQLTMRAFRQSVSEKPELLKCLSDKGHWRYQSNNRGGLVQLCQRNVHASESRSIHYWDANNLYGIAQVQDMPIGEYKADLPKSKVGYFYDITISCPDSLKETKRWNTLPCGIIKAKSSLSDFEKERLESYNLKYIATKKLLMTNEPVRMLVWETYYDYMLTKGMTITVHSKIPVEKGPLMKDYILKNQENRQEVGKQSPYYNVYKLLNNALYGKMLEDTRKYTEIKQMDLEDKYEPYDKLQLYLTSKTRRFLEKDIELPQDQHIIITTHCDPSKSKCPWIGLAILDNSKIFMYKMFDRMLDWDNSVELLYMDTDSFIFTKDRNTLLSNFPYLSETKLGYMKDEYPNDEIYKFVGLGPKNYALFKSQNEFLCKKHKGVYKAIDCVEPNWYSYSDSSLKYIDCTYRSMNAITGLQEIKRRRIFSKLIDDKRSWLSVNVSKPIVNFTE